MNNVVFSTKNIDDFITEIANEVVKKFDAKKENQVQKSENKEQFLTVLEAAQFLKLRVPTIYSKVSRGELPVMKRGKRLYFSSFELFNYLKSGRKKSNMDLDMIANTYISKK